MKVDKIWVKESFLAPKAQPNKLVEPASRQQLKHLRQDILELLNKQRFVAFAKQPHFYYDNQLNCLWLFYDFKARPEDMFKYVDRLKIYAFQNWELPSMEQLQSITWEQLFTSSKKFQGSTVLSATPAPNEGIGHYRTVTLGYGNTGASNKTHTIVPIHPVAQRDIFGFMLAHALVPLVDGVEEKLKELYQLTTQNQARAASSAQEALTLSLRKLERHLLEADYVRARLPVLEPSYLSDMGKGLWELYQPEKPAGKGWVEIQLEKPWEARNPEQDVRDGVVAIDFGTSSTVVAYREHGKTTLLRVGMNDFFQIPTPEDYQNPTILAFIDLPKLLQAWQSESYQPDVNWDHFHFSHEALELFRKNEADRRVVASILTAIKQWPLSASEDQPLRISDQLTGTEMDIRPVHNPMPVRGEPIQVGPDDPFDPIELYAFYLGLFINHRANGLFLEYHMTFPITYPREVKQQILSSFARGLQRSLPASLLKSPKMDRFQVREEASEPAAYAACALGELDIEATDEGTAYAVFDFGGGTTDFDFGIYRTPTEHEEDQGYEKVIRHFGASGDMFLGGENLVAQLAYQTFQQNLEVCREFHIPFSLPAEAEPFPGHELFLDNSHVAQTNSTLLMAKVRHIWEEFLWTVPSHAESEVRRNQKRGERSRRHSDYISDMMAQGLKDTDFTLDPELETCSGENAKIVTHVELLNRERTKVKVPITINRNGLNHFLVSRVGKGIYRFFIAMQQSFDANGFTPDKIHILQAGNSSRSLLVQALFTMILQEKMTGWTPPTQGLENNPVWQGIHNAITYPEFIVHRPPQGDPSDPYKPTAKTGVAIGLLKLIPGETLLAITPNSEQEHGEAPFRFFVGRLRRGIFSPVLKQNGPYKDIHELGVPTRGVFVLVYSFSAQAALGTLKRGSSELSEKALRFFQGTEGKKVFVQAVGPSSVEVFLADSVEQILKNPELTSHRELIDLQKG
ncbi:MAG: hypothetical protein HQL54_07720 [Magnetococcales bacterium]|nr:hypothetical protein [Magnetococcales bacterium]